MNARSWPVVLALCFGLGGGWGCPAADDEGEPPAGCAQEGENAGDEGCCEGLSADFTNTCMPCVPLGETRTVDGPGCCEGLVVSDEPMADLVCMEPEATGG